MSPLLLLLLGCVPPEVNTQPPTPEPETPVAPEEPGTEQTSPTGADVAPLEVLVAGNNAFALDLLRVVAADGGNTFFSPVSISTALAMTYGGASGETATQMQQVLHLDLGPEQTHPGFQALGEALVDENNTLAIANRIWGNAGTVFLEPFLTLTRDQYGAELETVDFAEDTEGARVRINGWIAEQTQQMIPELLPDGVLDAMTRLVLTNAVYFKGTWAQTFSEDSTQDADFTRSDGTAVTVPLMHQTESFGYAKRGDHAVLSLPYAGEALEMRIWLPDATDGLPALVTGLDSSALTAELPSSKVQVWLPRFKLDERLAMADVLTSMGMPLPFDADKADFSGMTGARDLFISAVLHQAVVEVNEEGTEAAAATAVVMGVRSARPAPPPPSFRADHPFLFAIVHKPTGTVLFLGTVGSP